VYQDSTAVLGPLSRLSEPHAYDLCREHASRMTPPRGWELLRVAGGEDVSDDLVALADAVRRPAPEVPGAAAPGARPGPGRAAPSAPREGRGARGTAPSVPARPGDRDPARSGDRDPARHLHVIRSSDD
jgi:hypothetical protein